MASRIWGSTRLHNAWAKIHSMLNPICPNNHDCANCAHINSCLNKKAVMHPLPWYFWAGLAGSFMVPAFLTLKYPTWLLEHRKSKDDDESIGEQAPPELVKKSREIMAKVGVPHPEQVQVRVTDGPTAFVVGSTTPFAEKPTMLIPRTLVPFTDPDNVIEITVPEDGDATHQKQYFFGRVGDITPQQRQELLTTNGTLIPNQNEMDFIIGHEAAHLLHNHTLRATWEGLLAVLGSHLAIKSYNKLAFSAFNNRIPQMRGWVHVLGMIGMSSALTLLLTWEQEKEADITSAKKLGCAEEATELVKKVMTQNSVMEREGTSWHDLAHPPLKMQLNYMSSLIKDKESSVNK